MALVSSFIEPQDRRTTGPQDGRIVGPSEAREHAIRTIAFPAISTGIFGFPLDEATEIAVKTARDETRADSQLTQIVFACFGDEVLAAYRTAGVQD